MTRTRTIVKWTVNILWMCFGIATIVLLAAAMRMKDTKPCREIQVNIDAPGDNYFVDKKDILTVISSLTGGTPLRNPVGSFNLKQIESALKKNVWIKDAQLFFDNTEVLHVNIAERVPVARVFGPAGTTFYLDSSAMRLPLSDKFSAKVPVFTGFPSDKAVLSKADSVLLRDIKDLAMAIAKDSFCMAMTEQADIKPDGSFEMMMKLGSSIVLFGNAADAAEKLQRLKLFYRQVIPKAGLNYYSTINVQYAGQVVAARRGAADIAADSLRTLQLMQLLAAEAEKRAGDSLMNFIQDGPGNSADSSIIQQSIQRDDAVEAAGAAPAQPAAQQPAPAAKPAADKPAAAPPVKNTAPASRPAAPKPAAPKPAAPRPRAVMPPRNDY